MDTILHLQGDLNSKWEPLFLVHPISGLALPYLTLGELSHAGSRPVFGISSPVYADPSYRYPSSLHELALSYVALVKNVQPQGPYLLGGWSMGGMIAMFMAAILEKAGDMVVHVILLDSINPDNIPPFRTEDEHEDLVNLTYSRLLTASSALTRPKLRRFGSSSSAGGDSFPAEKIKPGPRVTVTELDSPTSWASTPSTNEMQSWDMECMPDENYTEDEYPSILPADKGMPVMEMTVLMREHISKGLWLISSWIKDNQTHKVAAPVTLFKCSVLEDIPETISRARRQSIKTNFADSKLGWKAGRLHVQSLKSAHDRIFDPQHAAEVTLALRALLQRCA
ncbi:hypothetical protein LTS08_004574 [Lithohypha guttulata]|nr:hypothetical protein LTS08_004574 [Lithohypha guttulata]